MGAVGGVRIGDDGDEVDCPFPFIAVTVNVYDVPTVNLVIVIGDDELVAV